MILDPDRRRRNAAGGGPGPEGPPPRRAFGLGSIRRVILIGMLVLAAGYRAGVHFGWITPLSAPAASPAASPAGADRDGGIPTVTLVEPDRGEVARAFENHESGVQVHGSGAVSRVLADDTRGSPHQRFLLKVDAGPSVLIAHNVELAQRVPGLSPGTRVEFSGEYEWNEKGGLVHWTHHDPAGRHPAGWLKVAGVLYR